MTCYRLWHMIVACLLVAAFTALALLPDESPTVGDQSVPTVHCQEDEVIGFNPVDPAPRQLSCVHVDASDSIVRPTTDTQKAVPERVTAFCAYYNRRFLLPDNMKGERDVHVQEGLRDNRRRPHNILG